jgi:hypothetical protein
MNKIHQISTGILLIVIILLFVERCGNAKTVNELQYQIGDKEILINYYRDANNRIVETNKLTQLRGAKQVAGLEKELKDLKIKKPVIVVKYKSGFRVDTLRYAFTDTLPCDDFIEPFVLDSGYIKFNGFVTNKRLTIYDLEVPNDLILVVGEHAKPWYKFQRDTVSVMVQNSNKHIKGTQLKSYSFTPKQPFYNKAWFKFAVFGAGLITGGVLLK